MTSDPCREEDGPDTITFLSCTFQVFPSFRQPKRSGIAKLTFDLYQLHPKDFLCCLAIRATLYDMYTLSYDFRCTTIKHLVR